MKHALNLFKNDSNYTSLMDDLVVNDEGDSVLMLAVRKNLPDLLNSLLNSPRCSSAILNKTNKNNETALSLALESKNLACIKLIVNSKYFTKETVGVLLEEVDNSVMRYSS